MFMRRWLNSLLLAGLAYSFIPAIAQPTVVGWLEPAQVGNERLVIAAKLDTGADTSSLHVSDMSLIRREDGEWVTFSVTGSDNRKVRLERKVERVARVKKAAGGVQERPTVLLGVCVGTTYRVTEVNLTDRTGLSLPLLVGRNFLADRFAVDSSRTNTLEPTCRTNVASSEFAG
jgi:hypothetical protein